MLASRAMVFAPAVDRFLERTPDTAADTAVEISFCVLGHQAEAPRDG